MDRRQSIQLLGRLALLGGTASAAAPAFAQGNNAIVLGQSVALSGPYGQLGQQYHLGARMFFNRLNANGGIGGRPVELRKLDDALDPDRCVANTKQFINDGVFALFGYVGTSTTAAALQLASEARVPLFAPLTGAQSLREPFNRYLAHVRASAWDEAAAIVKQTSAVGIQRVAVYHHDDADGQAGLEGMRRALSKAKLEPVSVGVMPAGSAELSALVANALSARAEAVVVVAPYKQTAVFVRLARKGGFMGTIYTLSSVGTQALLDELGAVASGVAVTQVVPFPYTPTNSLSAEYLAELKTDDARGLSPNYASMEGYVAAKVFTEVARRMRAPSREGFLAALQGLSQLTLGNLNLSYGPVRNAGSTFVEITLLTKDGNVRR